MSEMYQMVADEKELRWFFNNVLVTPLIQESYSAVLTARFKKLTEEERAEVGIAKRESEFLTTQTFRVRKFTNAADFEADNGWTFENFIKKLRRFNIDKRAYLTSGGYPLPEKCLAVIFYVNPCDEIKVADEIGRKLNDTKTAIVKAMLNGKDTGSNLQSFQTFSNIESNVKHARAHCKGSSYWLDFDIDVPTWFRSSAYFNTMKDLLNEYFGLGNYIIIDTSGGYHILIRTTAIHKNPHLFCNDVYGIYWRAVTVDGMPAYVDDKGTDKFECIVNDCQIPGIPLPGTFQYGRPVKVINKAEFNPVF